MKKVLLKTSFAGQEVWPAGSIQEMEDSQADRFVEAGFAEYIEDTGKKRQQRVSKAPEER